MALFCVLFVGVLLLACKTVTLCDHNEVKVEGDLCRTGAPVSVHAKSQKGLYKWLFQTAKLEKSNQIT